MKKFFIALLAMGMTFTGNVLAQEVAMESMEANKISEEEAKRLQEEQEKEMKEFEEMMKNEAKNAKKLAKREKKEKEFREFIESWQPVDYTDIDTNSMPNVVTFFKDSNEFFSTMAKVYSYIGYIQVETKDTIDAEGVSVTEMQVIGTDNKELSEHARTENVIKATADLSLASLQAANVTLDAPLALTDLVNDPLTAISLGKRIKKTLSTVKMGVSVIPLLKYKINDNKAARRQVENN